MIEIIPNQPINFLSIWEAQSCNDCNALKTKCLLLNGEKDWISFQVKNNPSDLLEFTGFCDNGTLIAYTTFDTGGTATSLTNMVLDSINKKVCVDNTANPGWVFFTTNPYTSGKAYRMKATISGVVSPTIARISDIGETIFSQDATGNMVIDFTFISNGNNVGVGIGPTGGGCVEDMELYELGSQLTIGKGWNVLDSDSVDGCGNKFCHTYEVVDPQLIISSFGITIGKRYKITVLITGMSTGTLVLTAGGIYEVYNGNGYYSTYLYCYTADPITFTPTDDFDGCFEVIQFGELANSLSAFLLNSNNDITRTIPCYPWNDVINGRLDFNSVDPIPDGCYTVCIYDESLLFSQSSDITMGIMEFDFDSGWALVNGITIVGSLGKLSIKDGGDANFDASYTFDLTDGGCYIMQIKFLNYDTANATAGNFTISLGGVVIYSCPDLTPANLGIVDVHFTWSGAFNGNIEFHSEAGALIDLEIDYVRIFVDPACGVDIDEASYCSQCINIKQDTGCTRQIVGQMDVVMDIDGNGKIKTAYGFYWQYDFVPMIRALYEFHNSSYPTEFDSMVNNSGTWSVNSAAIQKKWDLAIRSLSEEELNALSLILKTDVIYLTEDHLTFTDRFIRGDDRYYCPSKDISPSWPKKEKVNVADVEVEIMKKDKSVIFNNNI